MDYRIRYVKEGDLDQIQKIEEESFLHPFSKKQFIQLYANYNKIFFVAEKGKEILGYIIGIRGFRKITVASVAVKEEFRRKGIADKLIRYLIKMARAMVKTLELQVRIGNKPAIFFYEGVGFTCKSILHEYYPDKEDAILYCKTLR
jgi:ribosomal-protein-alanine N-acetyltransferase